MRQKECTTCLTPHTPLRKGECPSCARYRNRNGEARPQRLIEAAKWRAETGHSKQRDRPMFPTVYVLYGGREALYIGATGRGWRRTVQHAFLQPWWAQVERAKFFHAETREKALRLEEKMIRALRPKYNRVGVRHPATPRRDAAVEKES